MCTFLHFNILENTWALAQNRVMKGMIFYWFYNQLDKKSVCLWNLVLTFFHDSVQLHQLSDLIGSKISFSASHRWNRPVFHQAAIRDLVPFPDSLTTHKTNIRPLHLMLGYIVNSIVLAHSDIKLNCCYFIM